MIGGEDERNLHENGSDGVERGTRERTCLSVESLGKAGIEGLIDLRPHLAGKCQHSATIGSG